MRWLRRSIQKLARYVQPLVFQKSLWKDVPEIDRNHDWVLTPDEGKNWVKKFGFNQESQENWWLAMNCIAGVLEYLSLPDGDSRCVPRATLMAVQEKLDQLKARHRDTEQALAKLKKEEGSAPVWPIVVGALLLVAAAVAIGRGRLRVFRN